MSKFLSQSKNMKDEYCGTVVQIGEVKPVPGTDFLGTVMVIGREIIVRKDKVHEGQIMIYVSNECQLNTDFLSVNNEFQDSELNANYDEVLKTKTQMINDGASKEDIEKYVFSKRGYFKKSGRVRMTRIRGVVSMGYLITVEQMKAWCPSFELDAEVGYDFDTVNGELFVKAYMPPRKHDPSLHVGNKEEKRAAKFDGVVKGQFAFHYHPAQLNKDIRRLSPDMSVNISVKLHGTSFILGNVFKKYPVLPVNLFLKLPKCLQWTYRWYGVLYASRTVVKNGNIKPREHNHYYGTDVWAEYYELLKDFIPKGYTIYGEILGYCGGSNTMVQKNYDYKCKPGENKLMIYRVVRKRLFHKKVEFDVMDVQKFTLELQEKLRKKLGNAAAERIHPIDVLYNGTMRDLYPDIPVETHWHENVLAAMKSDPRFAIEDDEPMCRTKVPREGIVLRINGDPVAEAFKLKGLRFLGKEADDMDKGIVTDIEMLMGYSDEDSEAVTEL